MWFLAGSGESSAQEAGQAPTKAVAPFDTTQAKALQKSWANHPGVPFESINSIDMKLVVIPAGQFIMGSPESEPGRFDGETQHTVTLTKPFSIGVHQVTQSQYETVMGSNPSKYKGANNPVEMVRWDDAVAFCEKLSALPAERAAGRVYRLRTEAEWEYACRAGTTTAYSFGDDESQLGEYAWVFKNSEQTPFAVGTKLANPWGLYDMHGNVWDWCSDWYGPYAIEAASDPQGATTGLSRVLRGGCWYYDAAYCRTASRDAAKAADHSGIRSFRVALTVCAVLCRITNG